MNSSLIRRPPCSLTRSIIACSDSLYTYSWLEGENWTRIGIAIEFGTLSVIGNAFLIVFSRLNATSVSQSYPPFFGVISFFLGSYPNHSRYCIIVKSKQIFCEYGGLQYHANITPQFDAGDSININFAYKELMLNMWNSFGEDVSNLGISSTMGRVIILSSKASWM